MLRVHLVFSILTLLQNQCNCKASKKPSTHCSNTSCFTFVTDRKLNWAEANSSCTKKFRGDLASIRNKQEQRLIKDKLPAENEGFWIGLNDRKKENDFQWVDGTPYKFKSWLHTPSVQNIEDCVELYIDNINKEAKWNDKSCNEKLYFICRQTKKSTTPLTSTTKNQKDKTEHDTSKTNPSKYLKSTDSTTPSILMAKSHEAKAESRTPSAPIVKTQNAKTGTLAPGAFPVAAVASSFGIFLLVATILTIVLLWKVRKRKHLTKENGDDKESHVSLELESKNGQEDNDYEAPRVDDDEIHQVRYAIDLNVLKAYYTQMNEESLFGAQYRSITTPGSPTKIVASLPCNKVKNRYANIGAYDHSRVILSEDPQVEGSDYINANYIDGYNVSKRYIAAMGPKPETVNDFWKMVWEQKTCVIVMLTKTMEIGKVKCQQYWPNKGHAVYGDVRIELMSVLETLHFEIRKLELSKQSEPNEEVRTILHFYFTAWPDHNVPDNASGILDLRRQVNAAIKSQDTGPVIVHCSAGVGRTGTYIAIDALLNRSREDGSLPDVLGFITYMRGQRADMVQNENQYKFIHTAILEAVAFGDSEISATDLRHAVRKLNKVDSSNGKTYIQGQFELLDGVFPKRTNSDQAAAIIEQDEPTEVVPYEFNRVFLSSIPGKDITFINASFIGGFQCKRGFIATDAPLADTVNDFWRMVWERNVQTIVMVAKLNEKYKGSMITRYWPEEEPELYGNFTIFTLEKTSKGPYIERELEMKYLKTGDIRKIRHFHFFRWPLLTFPEESSMVLDLIHDVQNAQHFTGQRPILVHCSDGAGRTGAFCCLYIILERLKVEGAVDILMTARLLRTQRPRMISTLEQYKFCYNAVIAYLDSFNQYSNFEVKVFK